MSIFMFLSNYWTIVLSEFIKYLDFISLWRYNGRIKYFQVIKMNINPSDDRMIIIATTGVDTYLKETLRKIISPIISNTY